MYYLTHLLRHFQRLVIEVLSDRTEAFDRGKKFSDYRHLGSLQEYVLISHDTMNNVECFRRNEKGRWELYPYEQEQEIHLASIDFYCPIAAIYEDVAISKP
ncbi:Uma2 family endonuclease [Chroogloeocystis siderophila]|jgi:Uma2 family endonuclease|uniref:Uma2 family endonuclease n=1 Tax=Chroogloeocystis siderophila TaxID=329163 RepID=UPI000AE3D5BB|nr:Uma2 family endonuclease [Chroogloeocystis siderophila]